MGVWIVDEAFALVVLNMDLEALGNMVLEVVVDGNFATNAAREAH